MSDSDLIVINSTLLQLNGGLLGLDVMLLSLVPALLIAVDQGKGAYLQGQKGKMLISSALSLLRIAMLLFALGCAAGVLAFFNIQYYELYVCGGLSGLGLSLITIAAFRFARISFFIIGGKKL